MKVRIIYYSRGESGEMKLKKGARERREKEKKREELWSVFSH